VELQKVAQDDEIIKDDQNEGDISFAMNSKINEFKKQQ
jgi:hypothetical protein